MTAKSSLTEKLLLSEYAISDEPLRYLGVVPYVDSSQIKLWHALEKPRRNGLDPPVKACANRVAAPERWSLSGYLVQIESVPQKRQKVAR